MSHPIRLLLVDDEGSFLESSARFFARKGIECDTAISCSEAIQLVTSRNYDVAVMDMLMPGLSGIECMAELKKCLPQLAVIILTGHGALNTGIQGMKSGAFDYCLKPIEPNELLEKVQLAAGRLVRKG